MGVSKGDDKDEDPDKNSKRDEGMDGGHGHGGRKVTANSLLNSCGTGSL